MGGRKVFKWYSRAVINNYLTRMGASEHSCTERQCMIALGAVSDELRKYPMVTDRLTRFAGPQCYPHLDPSSVDYRVLANQVPKGEEERPHEDRKTRLSYIDGSTTGKHPARDRGCWRDNETQGIKQRATNTNTRNT